VFERCKRGVCIVNTSRGALVHGAALKEALAVGQVSAAYLDVLDTEPHPSVAMREDPRVVLTPHAAFYSERSLHDLRKSAAETLRNLLITGSTATLLNKELLHYANK
jgi:D-3-phosphoglycerate dehydrogenase/C-terminal binding protein